MLSRNEFVNRLRQLRKIDSKTGRATYSAIKVIGDYVQFRRDSTGHFRQLEIDELYSIYQNLDYIDTNNVKPYINGWKYSPACAILIAVKLYNREGVKA